MFVELISNTPDAEYVADYASSTCVDKEPDGKSLAHALKSGHESVLEHATFTFHITGISRACSHQLVRHRLASFSQKSQRYVNERAFDYVLPDSLIDNAEAITVFKDAMQTLRDSYDMLLKLGVPQEDARYLLPNACTTELVMTMNVRELRHFFNLRCCNRAQWEIRELAQRMLVICKTVAPSLFADAGPSCAKLHYCPEARSCGKYPQLKQLLEHWENDPKA